MKFEFDSVAVGRRIRQARNAKGWSQETLAEKCNTSTAQISKFELKGLSDMEWIIPISNALDTDLLTDTIDLEGTVGEIGKELLLLLILQHGSIETKYLLGKFYGLSESQITNEIVKLAKYGLIYRENYKGWDDDVHDRIFISAKGLITIKNMQLNTTQTEIIDENIEDVETYESIINEYASYQDFINANEAEKLIRNLSFSFCINENTVDEEEILTEHRINYIKYLKKNFEYGIETDYNIIDFLLYHYDDNIMPAYSCYHDILYRMALDIDNTKLQYCSDWYCLEKEYNAIFAKHNDDIVDETIEQFKEDFYWLNEEDENDLDDYYDNFEFVFSTLKLNFNNFLDMISQKPNVTFPDTWNENIYDILGLDAYADSLDSQHLYEEIKVLFKYTETLNKQLKLVEIDNMDSIYEKKKPEKSSAYPTDWFSIDEIKSFVDKNFGSAKTEFDIEIDKNLARINELIPETLDYYCFPQEWEDNGLASYIRNKYGIDEIYKQYQNE